jgi:hypothetical protein
MARAEDGYFDDLARGLADGTLTRGKALRLMGAAVVGGALGSLGIGEASADPPGCKRNGKTCTRGTQCCSGNCSGGTCQAQTTTTTTSTTSTSTTSTSTSTTSTSTSTTSTSTSTTSTSTTPMCRPDESSCAANSECCSSFCVNNTCRPIGNRFTCICADSPQFLETCSSLSCAQDGTPQLACASVCAGHGGVAGAFCQIDDVCPL